MIINAGKQALNISGVIIVGKVFGDPSISRYRITFLSGFSTEIFEDDMPRKQFVKLWKNSTENQISEMDNEDLVEISQDVINFISSRVPPLTKFLHELTDADLKNMVNGLAQHIKNRRS